MITIPHKLKLYPGHSGLHFFHPDGYYVFNPSYHHTKHVYKGTEDDKLVYDDMTLHSEDIFMEYLEFNKRYRLGNKKPFIIPTRLQLWTTGQCEELQFDPSHFYAAMLGMTL